MSNRSRYLKYILLSLCLALLILAIRAVVEMHGIMQSRNRRLSAFFDAYAMLLMDPGTRARAAVLPDIVGDGSVGSNDCSWRVAHLSYVIPVEAVESGRSWENLRSSRYSVFSDYFCHPGETETYILAVTGSGTAFPPDGGVKTEGLDEDTILLIEVADSGIHWMEPGDFVVFESPTANGQRSSHDPGSSVDEAFVVVFADGKMWLLRNDVPYDVLEQFFSVESARWVDRSAELAEFRVQ